MMVAMHASNVHGIPAVLTIRFVGLDCVKERAEDIGAKNLTTEYSEHTE